MKKNSHILLTPISPAAGKPLYEQVVDGIKREISLGRLAPNALLPSYRDLAESLLVSLITVKRAYEELEREGIIYGKQGLGTFVSENGMARSREARLAQVEAHLQEALKQGLDMGLSPEELLGLVDKQLGAHRKG